MAIPKNFIYPDEGLVCEHREPNGAICGKKFKTPQAQKGHERFVHGKWNTKPAATPLAPQVASQPGAGEDPPETTTEPTSELEELREEVKTLRLRKDKASLSGFSPQKPQAADVASASYLGELDPIIRKELQSRAFNLNGEKPESAFQQVAEGVRAVLDVAKGLNQGGGNGQLGDTLKLLGCNSLMELAEKLAASKVPAGLKIGGIDFSGISLTPRIEELIISLQAGEAKAAQARETAKFWSESIASLGRIISNPELLRGIASSFRGGGSGIAAQKENAYFTCPNPECGAPILTGELKAGDQIACGTCGKTFTAEVDDRQAGSASEPKPKKRQRVPKAPPEPEKEIIKCFCGQSLDVSGLETGSSVKCPSCGEQVKILSPDAAAIPLVIPKKSLGTLEERNRE